MTCRELLMQEHPSDVDARFYGGCHGCPSGWGYAPDPEWCSTRNSGNYSRCSECWDREIPSTEPTNSPDPAAEKGDAVNHPSHYNNGGMGCIEEMKLIFGIEATMHFCLLNAWKYRHRAIHKNGEEDMKKADWYIAKYQELKQLKEGDHVR